MPVLLGNPPPSLMGMTEARPASQPQIQEVIQAVETGSADHGAIVLAPADDHRVELSNQMGLRGRLILTDDRAEVRIVPLARVPTGFDEGLEALFGIVATHRVLPDLEAQELKPALALLWREGRDNPGLRG